MKQKDDVDQVWLSHWHEDHIRYLNLFADCPLWIPEKDFPPLTGIDIFLDWYNIKEADIRAFWKQEMLENNQYVKI